MLLANAHHALRAPFASLLELDPVLTHIHTQTCGGRLPKQLAINQHGGEGDGVHTEAPMSLG